MKGRRGFLVGLATSLVVGCANDATVSLNGAGATFPYPLYSKWIDEYKAVSPAVRINYQSIGSGGGVRQIVAGTVDFGASDVPTEPEEERGAAGPIVHVPTAVGSVVVSYNVLGLHEPLRLTPELLAAIYLGEVTRWDAPSIAAVNPGVTLPAQAIAVIYRTDGSGTTAIFTRYLAAVSSDWSKRVGAGKSVRWPVGIGAKGNEGVTGQLQATPGAIGFTELAYATQNGLPRAVIRNRAGRFVGPSSVAATAAAEAVAMPATLQVSLESAASEAAYPLAAYTYLLVYANTADARRGEALAHFLWWAVHDGQRFTRGLDYAPLPARVVSQVEQAIKALRAAGKPALAPSSSL
jgi:phosphate transport system substrate-binding protein